LRGFGLGLREMETGFLSGQIKLGQIPRLLREPPNSVEVNYTFRSFPTEKLLGNWIAATPPDFKFAAKAHQSITHIKRLKNVADASAKFIGSLKPLQEANKLGPVLFQLPPNLKFDLNPCRTLLQNCRAKPVARSNSGTHRGLSRMCSTPWPSETLRFAWPKAMT
jgi:uncharacterized protein DUF72